MNVFTLYNSNSLYSSFFLYGFYILNYISFIFIMRLFVLILRMTSSEKHYTHIHTPFLLCWYVYHVFLYFLSPKEAAFLSTYSQSGAMQDPPVRLLCSCSHPLSFRRGHENKRHCLKYIVISLLNWWWYILYTAYKKYLAFSCFVLLLLLPLSITMAMIGIFDSDQQGKKTNEIK